MTRKFSRTSVLFALALGCGTTSGRVNPDETSAAGHRHEAERERRAAAAQRMLYDPDRTHSDSAAAVDPSDPMARGSLFQNPTEEHLHRAEQHMAHARAHEDAALELERFESKHCAHIPARERAACPILGPVTEIRDVPNGVRVELSSTVSVAAVVSRMRCHQAFARTRAYADEAATCPLYVRGIDIRRSVDGKAVEILANSPDLVRHVRAAAREQAIPSPQARTP